MADLFGGVIAVPEPTISGVFLFTPDFVISRTPAFDYIVNKISDKKEQRILTRAGCHRWEIHSILTEPDPSTLYTFYDAHRSPMQCFYFYDPYECGGPPDPTGEKTTGRYIARFAEANLSLQAVLDRVVDGTLEIVEVNTSTYEPYISMFLPLVNDPRRVEAQSQAALNLAVQYDEQHAVHMVVISHPLAPEPIRVADRRCYGAQTFGENPTDLQGTYLPRLLGWDISQDIGASDQASFLFDDADGVWFEYLKQYTLDQATVKFIVNVHYGVQWPIYLWAGFATDWERDQIAGTFRLICSGGISQLQQQFPPRIISTVCPVEFNVAPFCPYTVYGSGGDPATCDKSLDGTKGCVSHGMREYFQGVVIKPQEAHGQLPGRIFRKTYTAVSTPIKTVYGQVIPVVYGIGRQIVEGLIFECRDESEFLAASAFLSEGLIQEIGQILLDGMTQHYGYSPVAMNGGIGPANIDMNNPSGPRGTQIDPDFRCSRASWVCVRRTDQVGFDNPNTPHDIKIEVLKGAPCTSVWRWTGPFLNSGLFPTSNPIAIALDVLLRTINYTYEFEQYIPNYSNSLGIFVSIDAYYDAAAFCNDIVNTMVGEGTETRFEFRGVIREQKPAIDHIREILQNVPVDLVFTFAALKFKVRRNDIANPPDWTVIFAKDENIIDGSFQSSRYKPAFNKLSILFSDPDYDFAQNEVAVYDEAYQKRIGFYSPYYPDTRMPLVLTKQLTLNGVFTRSQVERLGVQLLREELGGSTPTEQTQARMVTMSAPLIGLTVEVGDVSKVIHEDLPGGEAWVRWHHWRYSNQMTVEFSGKTITESMYGGPAIQQSSPMEGEPVKGIPGGSQGSDGSENELEALEPPVISLDSVNYATATVGVSVPPPMVNYLVFEEGTDEGFTSPIDRILPPTMRQVTVMGAVDSPRWVRAKWRRSTDPLEESAWSNVLAIEFPQVPTGSIEGAPLPAGLEAPPVPIVRAVWGWDDCIELDILQVLDIDGQIDIDVGYADPFQTGSGAYGVSGLKIINRSSWNVSVVEAGLTMLPQSGRTYRGYPTLPAGFTENDPLANPDFVHSNIPDYVEPTVEWNYRTGGNLVYNSTLDASLCPPGITPTDPHYYDYISRAPTVGENGYPNYGWFPVKGGSIRVTNWDVKAPPSGQTYYATVSLGGVRTIGIFVEALGRTVEPPFLPAIISPGYFDNFVAEKGYVWAKLSNGMVFAGQAQNLDPIAMAGIHVEVDYTENKLLPTDDFILFVCDDTTSIWPDLNSPDGKWWTIFESAELPEGVECQQIARGSNLFATTYKGLPLDPSKTYRLRVGARRPISVTQKTFLYSATLSDLWFGQLGTAENLMRAMGIDPIEATGGVTNWEPPVVTEDDLPVNPNPGTAVIVIGETGVPTIWVWAGGMWRQPQIPDRYYRGGMLFAKATLTVEEDTSVTIVVPMDMTLTGWHATLKTPGTSTTEVDIKRGNVSLWATTPANRPKLTSGQTSNSGTTFDTVDLLAGDVLKMGMVSVGTNGQILSFQLEYKTKVKEN